MRSGPLVCGLPDDLSVALRPALPVRSPALVADLEAAGHHHGGHRGRSRLGGPRRWRADGRLALPDGADRHGGGAAAEVGGARLEGGQEGRLRADIKNAEVISKRLAGEGEAIF
mmetsp:Transcript_1081/g.4514  ORF Transcript_1081/g.4514 Transcript_1081/m.4514 type:complete len:114 (-) Transcript_1081:102-443(-)